MNAHARRALALVAGLVLIASALVAATPAVVPTHPAGASQFASNTDQDYATVELSDPWDFSNAADLPASGAQNLQSYNIANGVLDATVNPGGGLIMAETIAGSIPLGRSTTLHPVDATALRKVSFRMWAGTSASGGFFWYTCDHVIPDCENGFPFTVHQGWNNYSFDIPAQGDFRAGPAWSGIIKGIRLVPSGSTKIQILLDYLRITPTSGSNAPPTPPVPLPVIDSPSAAGGVDYATVVRRDAWDMSQPSDVASSENMSYGFSGGVLNGVNTGPHPDDAHFYLPLTSPIDANRFHRLSFNVYYTGPFGLGAGPGGGMVARLIWQTAGAPGVWQDSDDIVVYPGWNAVTVDLATSPPAAITDPAIPNRIGWANQLITAVRFDPDEDSGQRQFLVDNIKVAEDATGYGGATDITFHDNAWQPGTTADIYTSPTRGTFGGTRIASNLNVSRGFNTFHWRPNPLPSGTQWVYVLLKHGTDQARTFATGPLRMTASPSPLFGVNPFGSLEGMTVSPGGVRARGWAIDPDTANPIRVDFWVDGRTSIGSVMASGSRPDVQRAVPGFGPGHGFATDISVPQGTHSVCAYAINTGPGSNQPIGCRTVTVNNNPFGSLDAVAANVGFARIRGWAIDPNRTTPITTHVYVDGHLMKVLDADDARPDIAAALPGYGEDHGYHADLALASGTHSICTYGINEGPGGNALLGCKTVTLPANPFGALDVVRSANGSIRARGWAIDPDRAGPITVHLYVQGGGATPVVADSSRPDLAAAYPRYGKNHGFIADIPARGGAHTVCAYGINQDAGANTLLGCKTG
ncbi:MAG TPA: hypothetical protein VGN59_18455 [Acidimicrobiia bacterium]